MDTPSTSLQTREDLGVQQMVALEMLKPQIKAFTLHISSDTLRLQLLSLSASICHFTDDWMYKLVLRPHHWASRQEFASPPSSGPMKPQAPTRWQKRIGVESEPIDAAKLMAVLNWAVNVISVTLLTLKHTSDWTVC